MKYDDENSLITWDLYNFHTDVVPLNEKRKKSQTYDVDKWKDSKFAPNYKEHEDLVDQATLGLASSLRKLAWPFQSATIGCFLQDSLIYVVQLGYKEILVECFELTKCLLTPPNRPFFRVEDLLNSRLKCVS